MKQAFVNALLEAMRRNESIYLLSGDLGYGVLTPLSEQFPDRVINMGICEQNMASVAAGLACDGNTVFIYSIGNFPSLRCLEQIRNDIAFPRANVKIVSVGAGFSYGALGMSHHATEDLNIIKTIPYMTVLNPADPDETTLCMEAMLDGKGPFYLRLGRGKEKKLGQFKMPEGPDTPGFRVKVQGNDVALLGTGLVCSELEDVASLFVEEQLPSPDLFSVYQAKPLPDGLVRMLLGKGYRFIVTIEENQLEGGVGMSLLNTLYEKGYRGNILRLGIPDEFVDTVGDEAFLRARVGLDAQSIFERIMQAFEANNG